MATHEKIANLVHLIDRAMSTCHYGRAEKLFQQLLAEAFKSGNNKTIAEVSMAFMTCRRLRVLEVCEILKRIDPIQSQRKAQS